MMRKSILLPVSFVLFIACSPKSKEQQQEQKKVVPAAPVNQYQLQSLLWYQTSGEQNALYYQGYKLAHLVFDKKLSEWKKLPKARKKEKTCVIVDVDETVLNNSPFQGTLIHKDLDYSDSLWTVWVRSSQAKALPGALEFLKYASDRGADVFYVSNRSNGVQKEATRVNLEQLGFPNCKDTTFMYFREKESSKEKRRTHIAENYNILVLCGDNLADFSYFFDGRENNNRMDSVVKYKDLFGDQFIVFPNPMYGDWEKFLWKGEKSLTIAQKDSIRNASVSGF
jgi:5'-nucleotidase (lipoprotein e(P4) family)